MSISDIILVTSLRDVILHMHALASHNCDPGSILKLGVICELRLLLILSQGFSPGSPVFLPPQKSTSIRKIEKQFEKQKSILPQIDDHLKLIYMGNDVTLVKTWLYTCTYTFAV
jgi:hypothetical protein